MKVLLIGGYPGDGHRSMERYCKMLKTGLEAEGAQVEVIRPAFILGRFFRGNHYLNRFLRSLDKYGIFQIRLRWVVFARRGWVAHVMDQGDGIYAEWLRCGVTCHDLMAVRAARGEYPGQRTGFWGRLYQRRILRGLRAARGIACVSAATQTDVERLIGKSRVIPNGLDESWRPMDAGQAWGRIHGIGIPARMREAGYLLHVGGNQWYKNRKGLVRTFIELRKQPGVSLELVMVGPILPAGLMAELREAGIAGSVTVVTRIADEDLRALYSMATVFVFPSINEGFGWPIVEAQACGCPVVATDGEAMRETGGDAAVYAKPGCFGDAVLAVARMDAERKQSLRAAGLGNAGRYSAQAMARRYMEFYKEMAEAR